MDPNIFAFNPLQDIFGRLPWFGGYMDQLATFIFLAKIIIFLILVMYAHKVLGLGNKTTFLVGALVFMVFFTDFWIFGSLIAIGLTIIAFLIVGLLGFIS